MSDDNEGPRVVSASREIAAAADQIFELIADPAQQPRWDGNDNLANAEGGQRVRTVGDIFTMTLTNGGRSGQSCRRVRRRTSHRLESSDRQVSSRRASVALGARAAGRCPHPGDAHLRLDALDRSAPIRACPRNDQRQAAGIAGSAGGARRAPLNSAPLTLGRSLAVHLDSVPRWALVECVPIFDKATGRVVAVIVLLIAIAASLRGYLPGVQRADRANRRTAARRWFTLRPCSVSSLVIVAVALIARLRDPRRAASSASPLSKTGFRTAAAGRRGG